jgi:hypothetical protein
MSINTSTFLSDIILFLRDSLRLTMIDPLDRTEGFIFTSYPKTNVQYPIITIKNTGLKTTKLGIGSEVNLIDLNIEIRIWARNSKENDILTQDIINELRQLQYGTNSTTENEIFGFTLLSSNPIVETEGDNTIHSKVLTFNYKAILQ